MTSAALAVAIERLLRTADGLGLTNAGIKLNDAIVALDQTATTSPPSSRRIAINA